MLSGRRLKRYLPLLAAVRAKKNIKEKKEACRAGKIAKPRDVLQQMRKQHPGTMRALSFNDDVLSQIVFKIMQDLREEYSKSGDPGAGEQDGASAAPANESRDAASVPAPFSFPLAARWCFEAALGPRRGSCAVESS